MIINNRQISENHPAKQAFRVWSFGFRDCGTGQISTHIGITILAELAIVLNSALVTRMKPGVWNLKLALVIFANLFVFFTNKGADTIINLLSHYSFVEKPCNHRIYPCLLRHFRTAEVR